MRAAPNAAELALQALGITDPGEIDVEVVARSLGAKVKYRRLTSCEARIVGRDGNAIITVDSRVHPRRQRFSVAHELGHWHRHRGVCLLCRSGDIGRPLSDGRRTSLAANPELQADAYASDLLLPQYIFRPMAADIDRLTLASVRSLAEQFQTSLTATAIRALQTNRFPAMLVCHAQSGMRWFRRPPIVPDRWFPRPDLQPESPAFKSLFSGIPEAKQPVACRASWWFDHPAAGRFTIAEQSFGLPNNQLATLLLFTDKKMLELG
jgi:Zn-dependent peptidase ImmA (M78 family)